jgi:hypothetical protein
MVFVQTEAVLVQYGSTEHVHSALPLLPVQVW